MPGETAPTGRPHVHGASAALALRASHADRDRTVDVLRRAGGDGRLTAAELDERLEVALTARTLGELAGLTVDLPLVAGGSHGTAVGVGEVLRIDQRGGSFRRDGRWAVPRRVELRSSWADVTLDLSEAVITQGALCITMDMKGGILRLVAGPGVVVNTDSLSVSYGKVEVPQAVDVEVPTTLQVELVGRIAHSRVVVRPPRRTFRQWLHRGSV
ncbi:DUF1707 domain-containing protein [Streptomyces sp. NPDC057579]|uniref:DUF1707 SHOCT-like domain-containing protein n=1 Tax=Streptomyces sp. NPDC057579 TaxID=3346172 RepID=UPI0036B8B596